MNIPLPTLGSYFVIRERSFLDSTTGPVLVVESDPSRWALQFWNVAFGTVNLFVFPDPNMGVTGGYLVQQPYTEWWFERHGAMVQQAWYANITPVGNFVGCYEILYRPPPGVS